VFGVFWVKPRWGDVCWGGGEKKMGQNIKNPEKISSQKLSGEEQRIEGNSKNQGELGSRALLRVND